MVVSSELRKSAGAARPLISVPNFLAGGGVVRVVKRSTISLNRPGAQDGVIKHSLHAVPVMSVFRDPQKITGNLEMSIGATWGFEAGMCGRQTISELPTARLSERLVRTPSTRGEALRGLKHVETIFCGPQMHFAAQCNVGLHGGTERVHVAVGVLEGKHIVTFGKRAKVSVVFEIALRHVPIEALATALIGEKKIFGERI